MPGPVKSVSLRPPPLNATKEKLRRGETVIGTLTLLPEPSLAELVGTVGYDFIVSDMEHAAVDGLAVEGMVRAAEAVGTTPIIRVREIAERQLLWVLDTGAQGIVFPLIEDPIQARNAFKLTHYPPLGSRTLCSGTRLAGRGAYRSDFGPLVEHVNEQLLLVGLIETPKGVEMISEIVREGMDVFIVGRSDLSMKMSLHYAPWDERVMDATKRVLATVIEKGKVAGVLAYTVEGAHRWMEFGCRFIIYSQPEFILSEHYAQSLNAMKAHLESHLSVGTVS